MKSRILTALVHGGWYLLALLPFRVLYILSDVLYFFVCHVFKYRRRILRKNMKDSFPEKSSDELHDIERGFYHYFCDYIVETLKLMTISKEQLLKRMTFKGTDTISEIVEEGQSCAVYLGHLGNWEWITSLPYWISEKGQCCQIYHPLENAEMDKLMTGVRERQGALCIPMAESLRRIVEFKKANRPIVIGYIADQVPFWNNIHHWCDFLHHDTPVLTGSEKLIKKTRQAVFYGYVTRTKRGHYVCDMQLITRHPEQMADYELTDIYFQRLEENIREVPSLWLWTHNRWKRTREEFNIRYDAATGKVSLDDLETIKKKKGLV